MTPESHDPREIPILTDTIESGAPDGAEAARAAVLHDALQSAGALVRQAARDIDPARLERLIERLRGELPSLIERIMLELGD